MYSLREIFTAIHHHFYPRSPALHHNTYYYCHILSAISESIQEKKEVMYVSFSK